MKTQFDELFDAVALRGLEWDSDLSRTPLFRAVELGGEAGEALNEVKKLERQRSGIAGSTSSVEKLSEELADVLITTFRLAAVYNIDLWGATVKKFNATSDRYSLQTKMKLP